MAISHVCCTLGLFAQTGRRGPSAHGLSGAHYLQCLLQEVGRLAPSRPAAMGPELDASRAL
eukprot:8939029-Alexandrium_andersonii.AAC.1